MAEFQERSTHEERIARQLGRLGTELTDEIMAALGDPPVLANMTDEMWTAIGQRYSGVLLATLTETFVAMAEQAMLDTGLTVDIAVITEAAANWARQYSFELVKGINDTSRRMLQSAVSDFFESNLSLRDLQTRITSVFGPVRAAQIAATEVTRASVQGERSVIRELERGGARMRPVWHTARDERVCPLCSPRDGQEITDGVYPPIHVGDRCWVSYEPIVVAT